MIKRQGCPSRRRASGQGCKFSKKNDCTLYSKDTDLAQYKSEIERYCPDVPELIVWGRDCTPIGFPDRMTRRILVLQSVGFSGKLYSSEHEQKFSAEHSEVKLERDPETQHRFILKIDGISIFQSFRDMARKLLENMDFGQPGSRQRSGIRR